jgi:alanine dehydrogenase
MDVESFASKFSFGRGGLLPQEDMLEVASKSRSLSIGILKERDPNESRIALTPQAVDILVKNDYKIIVERGAGTGASFTDEKYSEAGAQIASTAEEVYESDILLKVAPFAIEDIEMLHPKQTIISSFLIRPSSLQTIKALTEKKVTAIGFEYMVDLNGIYPVVRSMSEIGGNISIMVAAEYLSNENNGKGVLLGGITGISPAEVVILGANTAGEFAARAALGLGATVKIFDNHFERLINIQASLGQRVFTSNYHSPVLRKALSSAEVVIGALQLVEEGQAFYVSEDMIRQMKHGSIIVDLSIDQGGCFETSKCTTHKQPTFEKFGVVHYCVPNITSRVARTSSIALSNIFLPVLLKMGEMGGSANYIKKDFTTRQGVYIYNGILTNHYIGKKLGIPYRNIDLLMAAF